MQIAVLMPSGCNVNGKLQTCSFFNCPLVPNPFLILDSFGWPAKCSRQGGGNAHSMNSGFYAACAGLLASDQSLDIAANNLANLNTTGFRGQTELFRSLVAQSGGVPMTALNRAINNYGVIGGTYMNANPGHLGETGNPLDFALEGPGFLAVQTKAGLRYTRNGNFQVDTDGSLLTATGDHVLGDQGPVKLPNGPVTSQWRWDDFCCRGRSRQTPNRGN